MKVVTTGSQGILVVLDGIDGCGKSSQAEALATRLRAAGFKCVGLKEPTTGEWGRKLRSSATEGRLPPDEELEVILKDRRDDVTTNIAPALRDGTIVILDRYYTSSIAYQGARGLPVDYILDRNKEFPRPDLIFLLQVDPEVAQARIVARDGKPDNFENLDEQREVARRFDEIDLQGIYRLDGTLPKKYLEEIIFRIVTQRLVSSKSLLPPSGSIPRVGGLTSDGLEGADDLLRRACEIYGAFTLEGHGIDPGLIDEVRRLGMEFFALPEKAKLEYHLEGRGRGYIPTQAERLGKTLGDDGPGDLKETLNIGPEGKGELIPDEPRGLAAALRKLYADCNALAGKLLSAFARSYGLPEDYFSAYVDKPKPILRLTHYPPYKEKALDRQLRATPHTDYGCVTILFPDSEVGGLQIYVPGRHWIDVGVSPGTSVVHVGDLMQRWTNGGFISPLHQVVVPERSGFEGRSRLSVVFLHNPNPDALIQPIEPCCAEGLPPAYAAVTAGEYLKSKSSASRDMSKPWNEL